MVVPFNYPWLFCKIFRRLNPLQPLGHPSRRHGDNPCSAPESAASIAHHEHQWRRRLLNLLNIMSRYLRVPRVILHVFGGPVGSQRADLAEPGAKSSSLAVVSQGSCGFCWSSFSTMDYETPLVCHSGRNCKLPFPDQSIFEIFPSRCKKLAPCQPSPHVTYIYLYIFCGVDSFKNYKSGQLRAWHVVRLMQKFSIAVYRRGIMYRFLYKLPCFFI